MLTSRYWARIQKGIDIHGFLSYCIIHNAGVHERYTNGTVFLGDNDMFKLFGAILLTVLCLCSTVLAIHDEPIKVEAEGSIILGDDSTIGQAKAAALNNARRAALEKATGVEVRGSSTVYNFQMINDLVVTATKGIIVKENVLKNSCAEKDQQLSCAARIEAWVTPLRVERRGNFGVGKVVVLRAGGTDPSANPVFQSRDEIVIKVSANPEAYLNIFSVDQNGVISKLYPNEFCSYEKTPAGKEVVFPDEEQRKSGLRLKVRTPKGVKKAVESVLVIATKEKTNFLSDSKVENPTITDLMRELSEMDPSFWAEKTVGYEVRE